VMRTDLRAAAAAPRGGSKRSGGKCSERTRGSARRGAQKTISSIADYRRRRFAATISFDFSRIRGRVQGRRMRSTQAVRKGAPARRLRDAVASDASDCAALVYAAARVRLMRAMLTYRRTSSLTFDVAPCRGAGIIPPRGFCSRSVDAPQRQQDDARAIHAASVRATMPNRSLFIPPCAAAAAGVAYVRR